MKKNLLILSLMISTLVLQAQTSFDLHERINTLKVHREVFPLIFSHPEVAQNDLFLKKVQSLAPWKRSLLMKSLDALDEDIPAPLLRSLLYWRFVEPSSQKTKKVLAYALFHRLMILRDMIEHPLTTLEKKKMAQELLINITYDSHITPSNIMTRYYPHILEKVELITKLNHQAFLEALLETELLTRPIHDELPELPSHVSSFLGFIPGNTIQLVLENQHSQDRIHWIQNQVPLLYRDKLFTHGHFKIPTPSNPIGHQAFQQDPLFHIVQKMIDRAQSSIVISQPILGGTVGLTFINHIINKVKKSPKIKVILLTTQEQDLFVHETKPVINYLNSVLAQQPQLGQNIKIYTQELNHSTPLHAINTYAPINLILRHQQTNAKYILIDGNSQNAEAFLGTKNFIDQMGAYDYDSNILIQGPMANLIYEVQRTELNLVDLKPAPQFVHFKGQETIRLGHTSPNADVKNLYPLILENILKAQEQIIIEQYFLYDPLIVDALIQQKLKNPTLDIYILLDLNIAYSMGGMPNTSFIEGLRKAGINVRARRVIESPLREHSEIFPFAAQKNHRCLLSFDSKTLISGSFYLNPESLGGFSTELAIETFSQKDIKKYEKQFLKDWNDPLKTFEYNIEDFQVHHDQKKYTTFFSRLFNAMGASFLNSLIKIDH